MLLIIEIIIYILNIYILGFDSLYILIISIESCITGLNLLYICYNMNDINNIYDEYNTLVLNQYIHKFIQCNDIICHNFHCNIIYDSYNINVINKNIFYVLLIILLEIFKILIWNNKILLLENFLVILTLPSLSIYILNIPMFIKICTTIKNYMLYIYYYIVSRITAFTINKLCKLCFDENNIEINYIELIDFFENINNSTIYIITFIKQFISVYVIYVFKNNNNNFIKYIFTIIHKYTNEELTYILNNKIEDPKIIYNIIQKRQWKKLLTTKSINSMFYIYNNLPNSKNNYFQNKINEYVFNFIRFSTLWTITSMNKIIGCIFELMMIYKLKILKINFNIVFHVIGMILIYINLFNVGAFMCVFGHLFSNIVYNIIKKYNNMTIYVLLSLLIITSNIYFFIVILFVLYYINIYGGLLMSVIYLFSFISNFNIVHIILLCIITHIITFIFYDNYKPIIIKEINENYIKPIECNSIENDYFIINTE